MRTLLDLAEPSDGWRLNFERRGVRAYKRVHDKVCGTHTLETRDGGASVHTCGVKKGRERYINVCVDKRAGLQAGEQGREGMLYVVCTHAGCWEGEER